MAVMPIARLFFPCANAEQDDAGNTTLVNPIDSILLPTGVEKNFTLGPIFFYLQVKEGLGTFYFRIEIKNERGRRLARTKPRKVVFTKQKRTVADEVIFKIREFRAESAGVIAFELFANEVVLATWDLPLIPIGE